MDWTKITLALIALLAAGLAVRIVIKSNSSSKKIVQKNNTVKGDIVGRDKITNKTK